jgi:phosphoserine phosphatase RsbU/P
MEKALIEDQMRIGGEFQQAMLPKGERAGSYFRAAAASLPAHWAGGDFYDYVEMGDGSLGLVLGDVAGQGLPAAVYSAMVLGFFAGHAVSGDSPSRTIAKMNRELYRRGIESRFVTLMYGSLRPNGQLLYCNAGHNPSLVVGKNGFRRLEDTGPIVGLFEGATYEQETVTLTHGEWLIAFSDGVSEALSATGEEYGEGRILSVVQPNLALDPQKLLEALFTDVREFTKGAAQRDDITAMVLRYGA